MELYNVGTPKLLYAAYTLTYALMSVLGIGIGIGVTAAIEDNEKTYQVTVGVLQVSYFFPNMLKIPKGQIKRHFISL